MNKLDKLITQTASILAIITIGLGAFGAHGLKKIVDASSLLSFETGVRYQMYHAIVLLIVGLCGARLSAKTKRWVLRLFLVAILFFSVSIYLLALQKPLGVSLSFLGPITPVGGILFMVGWFVLLWGVRSLKEE